ncbi:uncharacterized protein C9orf153 homolog isoform X4 [Cavia porcellus]|uniref:uncharacterized protein C9orf153 homolog isoform X4 n=1 Tax=Cavia porcellus TaxID=10141 RepID=UPI000661E6E5|nr:uncharacterized protein C9orf153 homolog [Cavia porcellus]
MSHLRVSSPAKDSSVQQCALAELYALVENFNEDSKKSSLLKTCSISLPEAQALLAKSLNTMAFISRTGSRREDTQPMFSTTVIKKERRKPPPMAERLHHSLLQGLFSLAGPPRARKRLMEGGINPPADPFPYNFIQEGLGALAQGTAEKTQSLQVLERPRLFRLVFEDKLSRYFLVDPEKQFMDLRDLEWRYFKGLAKWKHTTMVSIVEIKYNSEKRFVESPDMPGRLSPPLVHRSMFIYPQKEGNYDLKWNI